MVEVFATETTQLSALLVYDTEKTILDLKVYLITTMRRNNGKITHRFGTLEQVKSILRPYRNSVKDKEQFDNFLNTTRFEL